MNDKHCGQNTNGLTILTPWHTQVTCATATFVCDIFFAPEQHRGRMFIPFDSSPYLVPINGRSSVFWTPDNLCVNYGKCYRTCPDLFLLLPIGFCDTMTGQPLLVRKMNTTGSCGACRSNWCLLGHVIPNRLVTILCCLRYFASEYRDGDDETFLCQAWHASGAQALHSQSASARKPRQIGWVPWRSLHVAKQFDRCPHLWHQWPRGIFAVYPRCPPDSVDLFFWGPTGDLHMALGQVVVAAFLLQGLCGLGPIGRCLGSRWAERWRKCTIEGRWGFQHWTVVGQFYCNCGPSMVYLM